MCLSVGGGGRVVLVKNFSFFPSDITHIFISGYCLWTRDQGSTYLLLLWCWDQRLDKIPSPFFLFFFLVLFWVLFYFFCHQPE